jgi:DUF2075 family protein
MLIYESTKAGFLSDCDNRVIDVAVATEFRRRLDRYESHAEFRSWQGSLPSMADVLRDTAIPADAGIAIEYGIPGSSKRIDFLISGRGAEDAAHLIIVELKQWSTSQVSEKDGLLIANRGGYAHVEGTHPSYQAWSYAAFLRGFNDAVHDPQIGLQPCAYLHNHADDGVLTDTRYAPYLDRAPVFLRGEAEVQRLRAFVRTHLTKGDGGKLLRAIENGRLRPSKVIADGLAKMMKGHPEFVLIDDQKVVYENALAAARAAGPGHKRVVIVDGGPGTGKSVVALNLLSKLSGEGKGVRYISRNAAPRKVYESKLKGHFRTKEISGFFGGPNFHNVSANKFDVLVVDEAHRLNEKSGIFGNLGENQVKELIAAAHCSVFFVDDRQQVTLADIGTRAEVERWAEAAGAAVHRYSLKSQFRCSGSDGYLAWLDHALNLDDTPAAFDLGSFDFRVVDSPVELHRLIEERNGDNRARVVAGYCWDWKSKKNPEAYDIVMPDFGYARQWNLTDDGSLWLIAPQSVNQVGCIHTCQGLEVDYVGVIIGPDLLYRDGRLVSRVEARSSQDRSVRGWRRRAKVDPDGTAIRVREIIANTYRTLMTRGMKGCYVFCTDAETRDYFRKAASLL